MTIDNLTNVPHKPGVYIWKDIQGTILYVGKANDLNNRMKQYFKGMLNSYKTSKLVNEIKDFDYIITNNPKEALILERNLIEKHAPKFNILLLDDKRYPYISISLTSKLEIKMEYRIRSNKNKDTIYFGPFPTGFGARKIVDLLNRLTIYKEGLPSRETSIEYWRKEFEFVKSILANKSKSLLTTLTEKMFQAAENEQFEIAQELKETIEALGKFKDSSQDVELMSSDNIDVVSFYSSGNYLSISMFFYRTGMLLSKNDFIIEILIDPQETIEQFLSKYYKQNLHPDYIYTNVNVEIDGINIITPKIGQNKHIVDLALENARNNVDIKISNYMRKEELTIGALTELKALLNMPKLDHILMVDNSHTNNYLPVSVFVSYRNGLKQPKEYRKYNIESVQDRKADVDYMRQAIEKYFNSENNAIPDLLIVDGGKPQVNEAKFYLSIPIIGLVKDDNHKTKSMINLSGDEVKIESTNLMNFLSGIQIEVDRYAKQNHSNRRLTSLEGFLSKVDGVGPSTEKKLLNHFKTYSNIYNASLDSLKEVVSEKVAISIKKVLGEM